MRAKTKRRGLATRDPLAQRMWEGGATLKEIGEACGIPQGSINGWVGYVDPTPQPLGCPPFSGLAGESDEQRSFRRFPITSHKPG